MKKQWLCALVAFVFFALALPACLNAQSLGYELRSVSLSSGENPITSGLSASVRLAPASNSMFMEFTAQAEQAWFMMGPQWHGRRANIVLTGTLGYFQGAPWGGPYLTVDVPVGSIGGSPISVGTLQWPGLFAWEPDDWKNDGIPNPEPVYLGYYGDIHANIGPLGLSYSLQNFMDDPWNNLPGASWTMKARDDLLVSASVTRNINKERWMLWMGATWLISH